MLFLGLAHAHVVSTCSFSLFGLFIQQMFINNLYYARLYVRHRHYKDKAPVSKERAV